MSIPPNTLKTAAAVVFDLDGTLVDSLSSTFAAFNHGIVAVGGAPLEPKELVAFFGPGETRIFEKLVGADRAEEAFIASRDFMDRNLANVPLHEGVAELLDTLENLGLALAIFTGRGSETTDLILGHHGLLDRFGAVVTSDHVIHSKPSPEGLHMALGKLGVEAARALFVGDSPLDLVAARRAGAIAVAATWDLAVDRAALEAAGPDHWVHAPKDVEGLVRLAPGPAGHRPGS